MPQQRHDHCDPRDPPHAIVRTIGHERRSIVRLCDEIIDEMARCGYPDAARFALRLAWEEAISNAIHHGNRDRPDGTIEVAWHVDSRRTCVRITDQGEGFDPASIPDPTLDENLDCPTGRGLLLMRAYMTRVVFDPPGNTVHLIYDNPASGG